MKQHAAPQRIGVLLFDAFSLHCLANTVEPLRAANGFGGRLYDWRILSLDGAPLRSSSGLEIAVDGPLADASGDMLIVMPSYRFQQHATAQCQRALRAAARRFAVLAGFDTGSWLLARAGVLDGMRATIHWDEFNAFAEAFPHVEAQRERFVRDGNRITCSGAMAAFDLMTDLIGEAHGQALRLQVALLFMSPEATGPAQAMVPRSRAVARAIAEMSNNLEEPLSIPEIARRAGRSRRDLEARMQAEMGATPRAVYRRLRLLQAQRLVQDSDLSVAEIGLRCGYQNASALTRAFRAEFDISPRALRAPSGQGA